MSEKHIVYPFWFGGSASGFAACLSHPLDLVKVRLQTSGGKGYRSMSKTVGQILKNEGPFGLYHGLSASLLRQATYSTTRFGLYEHLKSTFSVDKTQTSSLVALASISGFFGGLAGNPADVLSVRMQHDSGLPLGLRRNYKNPIDGLIRMIREESWKVLFRGVWPNCTRATLMTVTQLVSYDSFKNLLITHTSLEDSLATHLSASIFAGFVATTVCSPVDVIKTRMMTATEIKVFTKFIIDVYRHEGIAWIFQGWLPSFTRLGPHTVATFLFLEQHKNIYRKVVGV